MKGNNSGLSFIRGSVFTLIGGVGFAVVWRSGQALSDNDIRLLVGVFVALIFVMAVGGLFVAWSTSQSRLRRQELQQDDMDELKKMALLLKMGWGRAPTINLRTPETPQLPGIGHWPYPVQGQGQTPTALDGDYRDSIDLE